MGTDTLMRTPDNLDRLGPFMDVNGRKFLQITDSTLLENGIYKDLFSAEMEGSEENVIPLQLTRKLLRQSEVDSFSVATASEQSGGKSTLTNAILEYPLLPTALTATTACATEIHYGAMPSVQIRYYAEPHGNRFEGGGPVFDGNHILSDDIWQRLLDYAMLCIREKIIYAETLQYHADRNLTEEGASWEDLQMSSRDPRHVIQLLLILFTTYVGQNKANPDSNVVRVCARRESLLELLGVRPDTDYAVLVRWNHPALKKGLVIVDLPGLNSDAHELTTANGKIRRSHDRIAIDYLQAVDSVFLFFDPTALAGGASQILNALLSGERMKHIVSPESRIIPILNKVDLNEQGIPYSTTQIRGILGDLNAPCVYPISSIAGEYRFVQNGLSSVRRTIKYRTTQKKTRELFQKMGMEVSEEQIDTAMLNELKNDYEHPYTFTDIHHETHQLNLDQWIRMMTTDYLARSQALKTIELLRLGMEANESIILRMNTRATMLRMLKGCGEQTTKRLIETLVKYMTSCVNDFNAQFQKNFQAMQSKIAEADQRTDALIKSYKSALDTVESDIASLIRGRVNTMQDNAFGNYILNPDGNFFTEHGWQLAVHNRKVFDALRDDLRKFSVLDRMKASEKLLADTIRYVQTAYDEAIRQLCQFYEALPSDMERRMNDSYRQSIQDYLKEQGGDASASEEHRRRFESIYGGLYNQLMRSILDEVTQFTTVAAEQLRQDRRVSNLQKKTIDSATSMVMGLQDRYRKSSEAYISNMTRETLAENVAFDRESLFSTLDQPFFTDSARQEFAVSVEQVFTEQYKLELQSTLMPKIQKERDHMNTVGPKERVNGLSEFIEQKLKQGTQTLDTELSNLEFYHAYVLGQMKGLLEEIKEPWNVLHDCDWASNELDSVYAIYERMQGNGNKEPSADLDAEGAGHGF